MVYKLKIKTTKYLYVYCIKIYILNEEAKYKKKKKTYTKLLKNKRIFSLLRHRPYQNFTKIKKQKKI